MKGGLTEPLEALRMYMDGARCCKTTEVALSLDREMEATATVIKYLILEKVL